MLSHAHAVTTVNPKRHSGFTIVELLIVIVVIAILAAITIIAYNGIQDRANDTTVKSDLTNAAKKIEMYKIIDGNGGAYPHSTDLTTLRTQLGSIGLKISKSAYDTTAISSNFLYFENDNGKDFALMVQSKSETDFYYSSITGEVQEWPNPSGGKFPSSGLTGLRPAVFGVVQNNGAGAWGFGSSGWAPEWTN